MTFTGIFTSWLRIKDREERWGCRVFTQDYTVYGKTVSNVIAVREGAYDHPDRIIVVGAHYDTFDNPGADDNASGVAGLLESARALYEADTNYSGA